MLYSHKKTSFFLNLRFESSVIQDSSLTMKKRLMGLNMFESSVIQDSSLTKATNKATTAMFESSVIQDSSLTLVR